MEKQVKNQIIMKHFWCDECSHYWKTNDFREDASIEGDYRFFSRCPMCNEERINKHHCYGQLEKAWASATGPQTEKGKNRARLNAVKHGKYMRVLTAMAPAKYGKYSNCDKCDEKKECEAGEVRYCPHQRGIMLRFLQAYEDGDVEALKAYAAMAQARTMGVLDNIFAEILNRGVLIEEPKLRSNGEQAETSEGIPIVEIKRNPLIKQIPEMMRTLGFEAEQQRMTPASNDAKDTDPSGNLKGIETASDFLKELRETLNTAIDGVSLKKRREQDEILQALEHDGSIENVKVEYPNKNVFKP